MNEAFCSLVKIGLIVRLKMEPICLSDVDYPLTQTRTTAIFGSVIAGEPPLELGQTTIPWKVCIENSEATKTLH